MRSYICRRCGESTLVGVPGAALRERSAERARKEHGLLARILHRGRIRREARQTEADAYLATPYRYNELPAVCPHCSYRGERRDRGRDPWWEPGLTYRD